MRFSEILYDSRKDTKKHIDEVQRLLSKVTDDLTERGIEHDHTKMNELKSAFDIATPRLKNLTYGSPEYKESLADLKPALDYHYAKERHHPFEHYENGIYGADLCDVIEMAADWVAASKRHEDGDPFKSLEINVERFNIEPQLAALLKNTIAFLVGQRNE
jgi:hypothetical protein